MLLIRAVPNHRISILFHKSPLWHSYLHIRIPCVCCMLNKCYGRAFEVLSSLSAAYLCSLSGQSRVSGPDVMPFHMSSSLFFYLEVYSLPQYYLSLQKPLPVTNFRPVLSFYPHPDFGFYSTFLIFLHCPGPVSAQYLKPHYYGIPS